MPRSPPVIARPNPLAPLVATAPTAMFRFERARVIKVASVRGPALPMATLTVVTVMAKLAEPLIRLNRWMPESVPLTLRIAPG